MSCVSGLVPEAGSSVAEKEAEHVSCVSSLGSRKTTWSVFFLFSAVNYLKMYCSKMLNFKKA